LLYHAKQAKYTYSIAGNIDKKDFKMTRCIILVIVLLTTINLIACGDDPANPADCNAITFTTTELPFGYLNKEYSTTIQTSGGEGELTFYWEASGGTLPSGLSLDSQSGVISGTPLEFGTYSILIIITDQCPDAHQSNARTYTLTINEFQECPALAITTTRLSNAEINQAYTQTIEVSGGLEEISFTSGSLPNGLSLDSSSRIISGTPTELGEYAVTITATDSCQPTAQQDTKDYILKVVEPGVYSIEELQDESKPRHPEVGSSVKINDVVVTSGVTDSYAFNMYKGFFIQEQGLGDAYRGIFVRVPAEMDTFSVAIGLQISLTGSYKEVSDNSTVSLEISDTITVGESVEVPRPIEVTFEDVKEGGLLAEAMEGVLVSIPAPTITKIDSNSIFTINQSNPDADDGMLVTDFVFKDVSWKPYIQEGLTLGAIRGPIYMNKIVPRDFADFGNVVSFCSPKAQAEPFVGTTKVIIKADKPDSTIYYTIDGSEPEVGGQTTRSSASPTFVILNQTTTVKWFATHGDEIEEINSAIYEIDNQCVVQEIVPIETYFFGDISESSGIQDENYIEDPQTTIHINDHSVLGFADLNQDGFDDIVAHNLWYDPYQGTMPHQHLVFINNQDNTFTNYSDQSGLRDVGASFFLYGDVDNDGDLDIFAGLGYPSVSQRHVMLINDGQAHFTVKSNSGIEGSANNCIAGTAVMADFNNDANLDIFIGNGHTQFVVSDQLYFGNGDGTFTNQTSKLVGNTARPSNASVACDFDNDGDQDIFVSNYGVSHLNGHNVLWQNDGNGNFTNTAEEKGFAYLKTGNYYLSSTGYGTTEEPNPGSGGYIGSNGFGMQCTDVNNDGYLDVIVSAISHADSSDDSRKWSDPTVLLINQGPENGYVFVNEFLERNLTFNEGDVDVDAVDFDNDGLVDLSMSRETKYESSYSDLNQKGWFGLMHQLEDGTFEDVGITSGINDLDDTQLRRGAAAQSHCYSDIDHDGDLDLLIGGRKNGETFAKGRPNYLLENLIGSSNRWLAVRLVGDGLNVNRDALGARVTLVFADRKLTRQVISSRGNWNASDTRVLHFGLGNLSCDFELLVNWPDGSETNIPSTEIPSNTYITISYTDGLINE
jgi:hypothetical protein